MNEPMWILMGFGFIISLSIVCLTVHEILDKYWTHKERMK